MIIKLTAIIITILRVIIIIDVNKKSSYIIYNIDIGNSLVIIDCTSSDR